MMDAAGGLVLVEAAAVWGAVLDRNSKIFLLCKLQKK
jgi:hypothetical protein